MSVAPLVPDPRGRRAAPAQAAPHRRREPHRPLPEESAWWRAAPLVERSRDLRALPPGALERLTDHYLPFTLRVLSRYESTLAVLVGDSDDMAAQGALWLVEAAREYDADRGVPFAGFLAKRLPLFVKPLGRSGGSGRYLADSELGYARARERSLSEHGREPTVAEVAAELGEDVNAVADRMRAVRVRRALRRPADVGSVDTGTFAVTAHAGVWAARPGSAGDDAGADVAVLAADDGRSATEALVLAAWHGDGTDARPNTRGFFAFWLEQYGRRSQKEIARAGRVGTTTVRTAQRAVLAGARLRLAAD